MHSNALTYEELASRLARAEEILDVICTAQTGEIVGDRNNLLRRLQKIEKALQKAHQALRQHQQTTELVAPRMLPHAEIAKQQQVGEAFRLISRIFQDTMDPILIKDLSGQVLDVNAEVERVYGWTREELIGQSVKLLSPPEWRERIEELIERCKRGEEVRNIEVVRWNKAGRRFPILLTLSLLTDYLGGPQLIATIAKDISALKQAEATLRKKNALAAIGATATEMIHEIANPLNGMYTTIQFLEQHVAERYEQADEILLSTVQDLKSETNRLQSLLQELRSFQPATLQLQPLSLTALAAELLVTEAHYYTKCGIRVEQQLPEGLPTVMADRERLRQALLNLYKNAVEAMPQGGALTVRAYAMDEHVALEVSDTGGGIPEEIDIFEPFVSTKSAGTGLGLAIIQQIVEAHGGEITYNSALGVGTTFTITLPIAG